MKTGWFALHKSILNAGAEVDTASYNLFDRRSWIDTEMYCSLMSPVLQITSVKIDIPTDDGDKVAQKIWREIQKIKRSTNKPCNAFYRTSVKEFRSAYHDWLKEAPNKNLLPINSSDPLATARTGWGMIVDTARSNKNPELLFWGLGLIGWVDIVLSTTTLCPLCFRWSFVGSRYCFLHTQSKYSDRTPSSAHIQYRKGKSLMRLADRQKVSIKFPLTIHGMKYGELLLADFLFFNTPSPDDILEFHQALQACPRTLELLGGEKIFKMDDSNLYDHIRQKLNPLEFSQAGLCYSIVMTENELKIQNSEAGRPKGTRSDRTNSRIKNIIELASNGVKKSKISTQLGISKSTLSNMINRYQEVQDAFGKAS